MHKDLGADRHTLTLFDGAVLALQLLAGLLLLLQLFANGGHASIQWSSSCSTPAPDRKRFHGIGPGSMHNILILPDIDCKKMVALGLRPLHDALDHRLAHQLGAALLHALLVVVREWQHAVHPQRVEGGHERHADLERGEGWRGERFCWLRVSSGRARGADIGPTHHHAVERCGGGLAGGDGHVSAEHTQPFGLLGPVGEHGIACALALTVAGG